MGLSSKKQTTRPIVSDWMAPKLQDYAGKVGEFGTMDPRQFVAPASDLQGRAFAEAGNLGGWRPHAGQALDMAKDAAGRGPASAAAARSGTRSIFDDGGIRKYLDPALESTIDPVLAAYDADVGRRHAGLQADAARNRTFGGSRHGVAVGDFMAEAARGRAGLEADMRRAAHAQALDAAMREADRAQQADLFNAGQETDVSKANAGLQEQAYLRSLQAIGLLGDLSDSTGANQRADLDAMAELGAVQREIASDYSNALPTQLQALASLYGAIPPASYVGQKSKSSGGFLGDLLTAVAPAVAGKIRFGK